ncbi:PaaI family thioesterase [Xanthomonas medicagonis]|uniref:PaaI family thioesterase n=1 Tax=Xanthomonas medicagonis TaxID=3160841 RepID=UPI0035129CDF
MDIQALARRIFDAQAFSRLLGARLGAISEGQVEIVIDMRDELRQQHGFAHGGVLSYLADNALTFAGGLALEGDALTAEFKINYLRPARGTRLIARAQTLGQGKRQAVCRCDIVSVEEDSERLCAVAQGTIVAAP